MSRVYMIGVAALACLVTATAAVAQSAPIGSSPIPNGLSGPGGTETFTPSPLGNGVGQTGSVTPSAGAIRSGRTGVPAVRHKSSARPRR